MASDRVPPRAVVGAEALAALAVPARLAILNHLLAAGPRTASECAPVVGESASNCSWHLRALAKVGLVEPAPPPEGDARARPWQATAVGFDLSGDLGPAGDVARRALAGIEADHADDLYRRYLARHELLPAEWTRVLGANGYTLDLTPEELDALVERLDDAIRPYVRTIRADAPEGSARVQVTLRAFLAPDVP
jgi:DNA-binding transcriptional ArsR family regulator